MKTIKLFLVNEDLTYDEVHKLAKMLYSAIGVGGSEAYDIYIEGHITTKVHIDNNGWGMS